MDQSVNMAVTKSKFSELVGQAAYGGKRYIMEKHRQPMAVLIGINEYQRWQEIDTSLLLSLRPRDDNPYVGPARAFVQRLSEQIA